MTSLCKFAFVPVLALFASVQILAQTPKPAFVLSEKDSLNKLYTARDYVRLTGGFSYKAVTGYTFRANINRNLSFQTFGQSNPTPEQATDPEGTIAYTPGGSFGSDPVTNIIGISNGTTSQSPTPSANGNGTATNQPMQVYTFPVIWFKTVPVNNNLNGAYYMRDINPESPAELRNYAAGGDGSLFSLRRNKIHTYNFNPSMDISEGAVNKLIKQNKTNLAQSTLIGVWGVTGSFDANGFMFAIKGRVKDTVMFSKKSVDFYDISKPDFSYGTDTTSAFMYTKSADNTGLNKYRETALRIGTFYRTGQPDNSVWGADNKSTILLGGDCDTTVVARTSMLTDEFKGLPALKGSLPELLVFNKQLSTHESAVFETYLAVKYGITLQKNYIAPNGNVLWDYAVNTTYNNRITAYGREDALGLNQKMSTTSHEEAPFFTDFRANDTYADSNSYHLSNKNRLLVMGFQPGNTADNSRYLIFGDNNDSISISASNQTSDGMTMSREWLVSTNIIPALPADRVLGWEIQNLTTTNLNDFKSTYLKSPGNDVGYALTNAPLKGSDGYLAWTVEQEYGPVMVKFGAKSAALHNTDYGYQITTEGHVKLISGGQIVNDSLFTVSKGQRIEVEKRGANVFLRVDGIRYRNTEVTMPTQAVNYYGAIVVEASPYDIKLSNVRHGGFVDTGNRIELSYATGKASAFANYRNGNTNLRIKRAGGTIEFIPTDEVDENRQKIIFNNIFWNNNDKFTFACTPTKQSKANKRNTTIEKEEEYNDDISIYYKDKSINNVAVVRVETSKASPATITVYELSGRKIQHIALPDEAGIRFADLNFSTGGVYIVRVITNNQQHTEKLIVKK